MKCKKKQVRVYINELNNKREKLTYPNVHQMSKHITFNQKKLAKKEKWMMNAETEFNQNKWSMII